MARVRTPQTTLVAALIVGALATLHGCANVVPQQESSPLEQKCQDRVVAMLNAVSPVATGKAITQQFCRCLVAKVDVAKLESGINGVKEIGLNPETLGFVTEHIPTVRACAKETGLWPGL